MPPTKSKKKQKASVDQMIINPTSTQNDNTMTIITDNINITPMTPSGPLSNFVDSIATVKLDDSLPVAGLQQKTKSGSNKSLFK